MSILTLANSRPFSSAKQETSYIIIITRERELFSEIAKFILALAVYSPVLEWCRFYFCSQYEYATVHPLRETKVGQADDIPIRHDVKIMNFKPVREERRDTINILVWLRRPFPSLPLLGPGSWGGGSLAGHTPGPRDYP